MSCWRFATVVFYLYFSFAFNTSAMSKHSNWRVRIPIGEKDKTPREKKKWSKSEYPQQNRNTKSSCWPTVQVNQNIWMGHSFSRLAFIVRASEHERFVFIRNSIILHLHSASVDWRWLWLTLCLFLVRCADNYEANSMSNWLVYRKWHRWGRRIKALCWKWWFWVSDHLPLFSVNLCKLAFVS